MPVREKSLIDDYLTGVVSSWYMQITKTHWVAAGVGFVVAVVAGVLYAKSHAPATVPTSSSDVASSTSSATTGTLPIAPSTRALPFPINALDTSISWNFKGSSTGNEVLIKNANTDIALLTGLIGKGKYDDYDLYNGIANDYGALGDGKLAYQNFNHAIAIHPAKGLAYVNLAQVMSNLGAEHTAADAYTKAVTVEGGTIAYHVARLTYLTQQFATDNARVVSAFTDASRQFGDAAPILTIEAEWLTDQKRYADAIKAWETVKSLSIGQDTSAIDAAIVRLKTKQ